MIRSQLKTRFRAQTNRLLLNPLFTGLFDLFLPARSLGDKGELCAERFLLRQGLVVVDRSYQNSIGEIDLIAVDDRTVVFVEVKTRTTDSAGAPEEAVDDTKQEKIVRTATSYLKHHDLLNCRSRFDVIAVTWPPTHREPSIKHFRDAFSVPENTW